MYPLMGKQFIFGVLFGSVILLLEVGLILFFEKTGTTNARDFFSWAKQKIVYRRGFKWLRKIIP